MGRWLGGWLRGDGRVAGCKGGLGQRLDASRGGVHGNVVEKKRGLEISEAWKEARGSAILSAVKPL